jgi:hypothetical protein
MSDDMIKQDQSEDLIVYPETKDLDENRSKQNISKRTMRNDIKSSQSPTEASYGQKNISVVIAILLLVIVLLLMGIIYMTIKTKLSFGSRRKASTPNHSLLSRFFILIKTILRICQNVL